MHQALTSSHIAAATAVLAAANSQVIFGTSGLRTQPCEETPFAFDCTPSHCFEIDQGSIGVSRFADSASRALSLSPVSDDDNTSAAGAGAPPPGGAGSDDSSNKPVPKITAYDVFYALFSIQMRHEVRFGEALVVYLVHEKGWIEEVSKAKREAMKNTSNGLEKLERKLELVRKNLAEKESAQYKLKTVVESIIQGVTSMFSRGGLSGIRKLWADIEALRGMRDDFEKRIVRAGIAREWLDRIGWSEYGYFFLTDAGLEALEKLKTFKDDKSMASMSVEDYLYTIEAQP